MQSDFYQHRLFEKNWYTFTGNGIRVSQQKLVKFHEYELKFEDIGTKITQYRGGNRRWLVPSVVFLLIALFIFGDRQLGGDVEKGAEWLYFFIGCLSALFYFFTVKNSCYLAKSNRVNAIEFLNNRPNKVALQDFLAEIISRRKEYLIERFGQLNSKLSYEAQFNNLNWLQDNEVLSAEEYKTKLAQLESFYPTVTTINSFNFSNN